VIRDLRGCASNSMSEGNIDSPEEYFQSQWQCDSQITFSCAYGGARILRIKFFWLSWQICFGKPSLAHWFHLSPEENPLGSMS
jgi:hypothetical protein